MNEKESIGYRQQYIMQCVWEAGEPVTIQMLLDRLEEKCGQRFSSSAVNAMVLKLVDKGYLAPAGKIHQAFRFEAVITEDEFELQEIQRAKNFTFKGKASRLLSALVRTDISEEELKKMKEILDHINE